MSRIEDYALIRDLQTAALVGVDGSIDWMCLPRFDSPACFAALLDDETAGRWVIAPSSRACATSRRYLPGTLVLETTWETEAGTARVLDLMPPRITTPTLIRIVEGISGTVTLRSELTLRFDYGHGLAFQGFVQVALTSAAQDTQPAVVATMMYLSFYAWLVILVGLVAAFWGIALGGLRNATLPRWFAIVTVALGVIGVLGPLAALVQVVLPLWLIAAAVVISLRQRSGSVHPAPLVRA